MMSAHGSDERTHGADRIRVGAIIAVWLIGVVCAVTFTAGGAAPTRLVPQGHSPFLDHDPRTWTFSRHLDPWRAVDYGHVGTDGLLDRWATFSTTSEQFTIFAQGEPDRTINDRLVWRMPAQRGEFRAMIELPECGLFFFRAIGVDEEAMYDAIAATVCDRGYPVMQPFADMQFLCRTGSDQIAWSVEVPAFFPTDSASLQVSASRDDCPLATYSGNNLGEEGFLTLEDGRRAVFNVDGERGRAGASYRAGPFTVHVVESGVEDTNELWLREIGLVLRLLRPVSAVEWERLRAAGR